MADSKRFIFTVHKVFKVRAATSLFQKNKLPFYIQKRPRGHKNWWLFGGNYKILLHALVNSSMSRVFLRIYHIEGEDCGILCGWRWCIHQRLYNLCRRYFVDIWNRYITIGPSMIYLPVTGRRQSRNDLGDKRNTMSANKNLKHIIDRICTLSLFSSAFSHLLMNQTIFLVWLKWQFWCFDISRAWVSETEHLFDLICRSPK